MVLKTSDGRFAKLKVDDIKYSEDSWTNWYAYDFVAEFVTFGKPVANPGRDCTEIFFRDPLGGKITLNGGGSVDAGEFSRECIAYRGSPPTIEDSTQEEAWFVPDVAGDYLVELTINESQDPASQDVAPVATVPGRRLGRTTQVIGSLPWSSTTVLRWIGPPMRSSRP